MKGTFLIVEDEENDVYFLIRALNKTGVPNPTEVVQDGQLAIDYLSGNGAFADRSVYPLPELVFLDLKLPRVHGLEVLKWIRAQPNLAPLVVIILTSSPVREDIERAYRLGANSYVVKPSSPEDLIQIAAHFRDWWLTHNEPPQGKDGA
jgi:CheY-like chemotaxis protein